MLAVGIIGNLLHRIQKLDALWAAVFRMADDASFKAEIPALEARLAELEDHLRLLLLPKDPNDDKDVIVEVKAGEGGDESALFAGDTRQLRSAKSPITPTRRIICMRVASIMVGTAFLRRG